MPAQVSYSHKDDVFCSFVEVYNNTGGEYMGRVALQKSSEGFAFCTNKSASTLVSLSREDLEKFIKLSIHLLEMNP